MQIPRGKFTWLELVTKDVQGALSFYRQVVGWTASAMPMGQGMTYQVLEANGRGVAGVMAPTPQMGGRDGKPSWVGYISTPDVDGDVERLKRAGGAVHRPPQDIPDVGRFAPVSDPQGAGFMLFQPKPPPGGAPPPATGPGTLGWSELYTTDWKAAFAFYSELFGWTQHEAMDMGSMGTYQLFGAGEGAIGGMMNQPKPGAPPSWQYYVNVEAIDAAGARVQKAGGKVVHGPVEVPGGAWVLQGVDPQGAPFALVAPKR